MNKRTFLKIIAQSLLLIGFSQTSVFSALKEIIKTDEEWEKILTPEQFIILRKEGTERPFTSPLNNEKREGEYVCVACNTKLFHSSMKYDSGTGWPSFFDFYKGNLKTKTDYKLLYPRIEYHCATCKGHHGHVFNDGPTGTGLRYCVNSVSIDFKSENKGKE